MTSPSSQPIRSRSNHERWTSIGLAAPRAALVVGLLRLADGLHVLGGRVDVGHGFKSTPGLSRLSGSSAAFAARSAAANGSGRCALVPRAMVAPDRVVVRDRAAGRDHRVRRRALDLRPLRLLIAAARRREHGEVRRRAVGVRVREPAGDDALAERLGRRRLTLSIERREPLPRDRALERLGRARPSRRACRAGTARAGTRPAMRAAAPSLATPPCCEQIASARTAGSATSPRSPAAAAPSRRRRPSSARASRGSISRQLDGSRPAWTISRTASSPVRSRRARRARSSAASRAGARAPTPR